MGIFRFPDYESEAMALIRSLKVQQPDLEKKQQQGRLLLWDRALDPEIQNQAQQAKLKQPAYVYQTSFD